MANSTDKWRDYFHSADSDIFDIIEKTITVAAYDDSDDFETKRNRIAEILLHTCDMGKAVPKSDHDKSSVNHSKDDDHGEITEMNGNPSYEWNESDGKESQLSEKVLRMREIIDNTEKKSDELLLDSLRRLQSMTLTYDILKETMIGKSVNALRKQHKSKEIQKLARTLVGDWKLIVYGWCNSAKATAGAKVSSESVQKSVPENKPTFHQQSKFKCDDEASFNTKLEVSKRKLHERYHEVKEAKKQRTAQFVDFHDLPAQRNQRTRPVKRCPNFHVR